MAMPPAATIPTVPSNPNIQIAAHPARTLPRQQGYEDPQNLKADLEEDRSIWLDGITRRGAEGRLATVGPPPSGWLATTARWDLARRGSRGWWLGFLGIARRRPEAGGVFFFFARRIDCNLFIYRSTLIPIFASHFYSYIPQLYIFAKLYLNKSLQEASRSVVLSCLLIFAIRVPISSA
jgi:hypothetical protein